ncbi:MAG: hypothetical protein FWG47_05485 [Propionibacteriaceae bacterium]|nr:hypothetical protein [Propionibacteriaceae bacterium]
MEWAGLNASPTTRTPVFLDDGKSCTHENRCRGANLGADRTPHTFFNIDYRFEEDSFHVLTRLTVAWPDDNRRHTADRISTIELAELGPVTFSHSVVHVLTE